MKKMYKSKLKNITLATASKTVLLISSLTLLLILPAQADDLLDRLEVATEELGKRQGAFYVKQVPELKDKMPDWNWDDQIREASKCVLDGIEKAKGRSVAEAYVAGIEIDSKKDVISLNNNESSLPEELKDEDQTLLGLMGTCNTMEISTVRLKESGFWDAVQDPAVMERLLAE